MSNHDETYNQETILNVRGVLARHRLVEELVKKQNLVELQRRWINSMRWQSRKCWKFFRTKIDKLSGI